MINLKKSTKYDEIFIKDNFDFSNIKEYVVTEILKEADVIKALNTNAYNNPSEFADTHRWLNDNPELFKVNILGLDITVAILENLLHWDIFEPQWEAILNIYSHGIGDKIIMVAYDTINHGKENFSYDIILNKIAKTIETLSQS